MDRDDHRRLWLLVVLVDRLRTTTSTPATLDAALALVRDRLPEDAPAWPELEPEAHALVQRLVSHR